MEQDDKMLRILLGIGTKRNVILEQFRDREDLKRQITQKTTPSISPDKPALKP